jgi:predicted amidohydrolase
MLKLATAQFFVSNEIDKNKNTIIKLTKIAKSEGADIIHFSECSLTGYFPEYEYSNAKYNKNEIESAINDLINASKINNIYISIGTPMFNKKKLPYNSIILINPKSGKIKQYNKRFLWADEYKYFSHGNKLLIIEINNIKIGFLICYEMNFFELIREYRRKNVNCLLISLYSCLNKKIKDYDKISKEIPVEYLSKDNQIWLSISNHCNGISSWICDPDGIKKKLPENKEFIEYTEINPNKIVKTKFDNDKELLLLRKRNNKNNIYI